MIETWASEEDLKAHGVGPAVSSGELLVGRLCFGDR